jgi:Tol biopolymer transport system component
LISLTVLAVVLGPPAAADEPSMVQITTHPELDGGPTWSADGTLIAFSSRRSGNDDIWIVPASGSTPTQLTTWPDPDAYPAWSPDGSQIAYASYHDGRFNIWVMPASGGTPTQLTDDPAGDWSPAWSPDGSQIAFTSYRSGSWDIWVMPATGGKPTQLTNAPEADGFPAWSPDGTQIAFASDRDGNFDIWVMPASGGEPTQLTDHPAEDQQPEWHGSTIAFESDRSTNWDIWVMPESGGEPTQLTTHPGIDVEAAWSRDGSKIALASTRSGNYDIWVMSLTNQNPDCQTARPSVTELWPPNHKFVLVDILGVTDPDGDRVTIEIDGVTQDEPLDVAGNKCPDARIEGTRLELRKERAGSGDGRVYVVSFTATDEKGGICSGDVSVCVPHDQSPHHRCGDSGQTVDSFGSCPENGGVELAAPRMTPEAVVLEYSLPENTFAGLAVFDVSGRMVSTLENSPMSSGSHEVSWDTRAIPSGVYYCRLQAAGVTLSRAIVLLR